ARGGKGGGVGPSKNLAEIGSRTPMHLGNVWSVDHQKTAVLGKLSGPSDSCQPLMGREVCDLLPLTEQHVVRKNDNRLRLLPDHRRESPVKHAGILPPAGLSLPAQRSSRRFRFFKLGSGRGIGGIP